MYLENPDAAVKLDYSNGLPVMKSQMFLVFTTRPFSSFIIGAYRLLKLAVKMHREETVVSSFRSLGIHLETIFLFPYIIVAFLN